METVSQRIVKCREKLGVSQSELARRLGVRPQAVQQWESGGLPKTGRLEKIAEVLGTTVAYLFGSESEQVSPHYPVGDDYVLIPHYSVKGSCGNGCQIDQFEVVGRIAFKRGWLKQRSINSERVHMICAHGDSMSPTIEDGAMVLVDTSKTEPRSGKVFVLMFEDELRIKRMFRSLRGEWRMASDNRDERRYPDEPLELDYVEIIGQCVWVGMDL